MVDKIKKKEEGINPNSFEHAWTLIIFVLMLTSISLMLISNVSAQGDILKPATFNKSYTILQTCATCTFVEITVSSVEGIIVSNQQMTNNGSGVWNYSLTPTLMSRHDVTGQGDLGGINTSFATFFEVSPSGKIVSTGDSILYALFSLFLFGIIFLLVFFVFIMPSSNDRDERGFENKIIKWKYFRIILIALTYAFTILLLNFLNGLAVNFSALTMFAGLLGFAFEVMLSLAWVFTLLLVLWIFFMLVHDTNVNKQLKKLTKARLF